MPENIIPLVRLVGNDEHDFPLDALPSPVLEFAVEGAAARGCPVEYVAGPLLAAVGLAAGTARKIQLKPGWTENPNLYLAVVGPPGTAKSAALSLANALVVKQDANMYKAYAEALEEYKRQLNDYEAKKADWKKNAPPFPGAEPVKPEEPKLSTIYTADTTVEALAALMQANPRGVGIIRDELTGWLRAMDMYRNGRGSDRQFFLTAWSGGTIKITRKTAQPLVLEDAFLTVAGGLTPDSLKQFQSPEAGEDGFLDRILFIFPPNPEPAPWTDATVPLDAYARMASVFDRLFALRPAPPLPLTAEAQRAFVSWYNQNAQETAEGGDALRGAMAKMPRQVARLALILQLAEDPAAAAVGVQAMQAAIKLAEYFKRTAARVRARLQETETDRNARQLAEWLARYARRHPGGATPREAQQARAGGCRSAAEAKALLNHAVAAGLITMIDGKYYPAGKRTGTQNASAS